LRDLNLSTFRGCLCATFGVRFLGGCGFCRLRFLSLGVSLGVIFFVLSALNSFLNFLESLLLDPLLGLVVLEVADGILELEEALISDLERAGDLFPVCHRAEVDILEGSE
jgi:hypothetical protein